MDLFSPPFVSRPASEARARREAHTGMWTQRRNMIMTMLLSARERGMTWKEVGQFTNQHHGQISSMLSSLHQHGFIFQLQEQRNGCHPYCHYSFREGFDDAAVFDEPAQTKAGKNRESLRQFVVDVSELVKNAERRLTSNYSDNENLTDLIDGILQAMRQLNNDKNRSD